MHPYITESMARVGCGASDTKEIAEIASKLSHLEWDTLDAMHNFGQHTTLTPVGSATRQGLISQFSDDDLICLSAYVNAHRNAVSTYAN